MKATLISLLSQHSVPFVDCGIAVDEPDSLLDKLRACLDGGDVVVTTGGVSMGDRDILRKVCGSSFLLPLQHLLRMWLRERVISDIANWHL